MMEVSSSVKTEEDENELSLELCIGRKCYDNKTAPAHKSEEEEDDDESSNVSKMMITSTICPFKREIQALRRQEARKKRDQKLKFKSTLSSCRGGDAFCVTNHEDRDAVVDEDEDDDDDEPPRKKDKCLSLSCNNNNTTQNGGPRKEEKYLKLKMNREPGLMGPYPTLPAMQYVPFPNGFAYHPHPHPSSLGSVVACTNALLDTRASGAGNEASDKDKRVSFDIAAAACRSFRPYTSSSSRNFEMSVVNAKSDASSAGSSPAVSDHHNSALQGGSSSITFPQDSRNAFSAGNGPKRSEIKSWDSMGVGSNEVKIRTKANHIINTTLLANTQVRESRCSEEPKPSTTLEDPNLGTKNPIDPVVLKKKTSNAVITNPLKTQLECNGTSSLPHMPCVSATGNGPNGKTITGFLYRYTKTEVCIVCVCHGTSFSPAEFVKHAGGADVEHPLRHITIVPSDLT